jgi:hypothetical protein
MSKLKLSNKAHSRLSRKYDKLANSRPYGSKSEKKFSILAYYHKRCYMNQVNLGRKLNKTEKQKVYKRTLNKFYRK